MYDVLTWTLEKIWDYLGFGDESDVCNICINYHENYTSYGQWHLAIYDYQWIFKNLSSSFIGIFPKASIKRNF